ncbi:MAG: hypothetical protein ACRDIF_05115 [Actinomycetota bacterium]
MDWLSDRLRAVGKTVYLEHVRRCPEGRIDIDHYRDDGPCLCRTKRSRIIDGGGAGEPAALAQPGRTHISVMMRPPR